MRNKFWTIICKVQTNNGNITDLFTPNLELLTIK